MIDPSQHYQAAIGAMSRGAWHEAERHVRSALTANPNYFQAAVLLGEILERITVPGQAAEAYDRAAKIIPGHALPFTRKAILLFRAVFGPPPHSLPSTFPAVSMTSLGANGKFGNQLLQYAFVRLYARAHGVSPQLPDWIGRDLFDLNDPFPRTALAPIDEKQFHLAEALCGQDVACVNRDVFGYFCGPTIAWAEKKNELRALFKPGKHVAPLIARAVTALNRRGKTLVAVHIRRGDFGYGKFWTAPTRWYLDWLKSLWDTLDRPVLYVASDEPQIVSEFSRFAPIGAADLDVCIPGAEFYLDHAILSQARHLAISNSTFSFTAAMLNERASLFLRPDPDRRCLVPFDPWNATVLLEPRLLQKPSQEDCELISHIVRPNGIAIHVGEFCASWTVSRALPSRA